MLATQTLTTRVAATYLFLSFLQILNIIIYKQTFYKFSNKLYSKLIQFCEDFSPMFFWNFPMFLQKVIQNFGNLLQKTRLSVSGHGQLTWVRFQLQWKMRFRKGSRYRRSEVEGPPHYSNNFVLCGVEVVRHSVSVEVICHSVGVEVIRHSTFRSDTDFKNVFTLKIFKFLWSGKLVYILGNICPKSIKNCY